MSSPKYYSGHVIPKLSVARSCFAGLYDYLPEERPIFYPSLGLLTRYVPPVSI
jgi:hypothetical protein